MPWVWYDRSDVRFKLSFDRRSSIHRSDVWKIEKEELGSRRGLFRTSVTLSKLEKFHCPYIENIKPPVVDDTWRSIILDFVHEDDIMFIPLDIICKDGVSQKYWWADARRFVRCIDPVRSDVWSKIEKPDITLIYGCDRYVHYEGCLGEYHLAYDEQMSASHLVLSDQLRDALASTGESCMFFRPEDIPGRPVQN